MKPKLMQCNVEIFIVLVISVMGCRLRYLTPSSYQSSAVRPVILRATDPLS